MSYINKFNKNRLFLISSCIVSALILFIFGFLDFSVDGDTLWHIKTGEYVFRNGFITNCRDVFSWMEELTWYPHEQTYDVFIYIIYRFWGLLGVRYAGVVFLTLTAWLCIFFNYRQKRCSAGYFVFMCLTFLVFPLRSTARPQDISMLLITSEFCVFYNFFTAESHTRKQISGFILAFVFNAFAISNLHGGAVYTLFLIPVIFGLANLICFTARFRDKRYASEISLLKDNFRYLFFSVVSGAAVALINPLGTGIYTYAFRHSDFAYSMINEWKPAEMSLDQIVYMFVVLGSAAFSKLKIFERKSLYRIFSIYLFFMLTLHMIRFENLLVFILLLFAYPSVSELFMSTFNPLVSFLISEEKSDGKLSAVRKLVKTRIFRDAKIVCLLAAVFAGAWILIRTSVILVSVHGRYSRNISAVSISERLPDSNLKSADESDMSPGNSFYEELAENNLSLLCIEWIKQNNINSNYYTSYNSGSWFIFNNQKSFIDSRNDPFMGSMSRVNATEELWNAVSSVTYEESFEEFCDRYEIEYVVLFPYQDGINELKAVYYNPDFELVFQDKTIPYDNLISTKSPYFRRQDAEQYTRGYIYRYRNYKKQQ